MAFPLRGTVKANTAINGGDITLTFDGGADAPQTGDIVLLFGGHGNDGASGGQGPITSGYTQRTLSTTAGNIVGGCWYKVMGATPDTSVQCEGGGDTGDGVGYAAIVLNGSLVDAAIFDNSDVLNDHASATQEGVADPSAITVNTVGAWVIAFACAELNDNTPGVPTNYTQLAGPLAANDTDPFSFTVVYREMATTGSEDPGSFTGWASDFYVTITVAIKPRGPFEQAVTGSLSTVGALSRETRATSLAGTVTTVGALLKHVQRALTGSLAPTGMLSGVKGLVKLIVTWARPGFARRGIFRQRTHLAPHRRLHIVFEAAVAIPVSLAGALSTSGVLVKQAQIIRDGTLASAGGLAKLMARAFTSTLTSSGTLAAVKTALVFLAGALSTAGALAKQTRNGSTALLATTGALLKQAHKSFAGTITASATLSSRKTVLKAIEGALALSGVLIRQTGHTLTATVTLAGDLARRTHRTLSGVLQTAGAVDSVLNPIVVLLRSLRARGVFRSTSARGSHEALGARASADGLDGIGVEDE